MKKENLINRFKIKAASRKRVLFERYQTLICSTENASIIVDEIHEDLGEDNLVTVSDIYYCRRYFAKRGTSKLNLSFNEDKNLSQKNVSWDDLKWTNPDTIPRFKLRSKFAPPEE